MKLLFGRDKNRYSFWSAREFTATENHNRNNNNDEMVFDSDKNWCEESRKTAAAPTGSQNTHTHTHKYEKNLN